MNAEEKKKKSRELSREAWERKQRRVNAITSAHDEQPLLNISVDDYDMLVFIAKEAGRFWKLVRYMPGANILGHRSRQQRKDARQKALKKALELVKHPLMENKTARGMKPKPVLQIDYDNAEIVYEYKSADEALNSGAVNERRHILYPMLYGKRSKPHKGWFLVFKEDFEKGKMPEKLKQRFIEKGFNFNEQ